MKAISIRRTVAVALVVAAGTVAGCGGSDDTTTATEATPAATAAKTPAAADAAAGQLQLTAVEGTNGLGFEPAELSADAGTVTITMENPDGDKMPHAIAIEGNGVDESGEIVDAGGTSTVTADLQPGEYTFYCPVGQHRQNGMEGTLTVK